MGKFGSRQKGKTGEREIAKLLQGWWRQIEPGCEFASTPLSGGWNKASIRGGMKLSGDLCTTAAHFPFVVEVKRRERWTLDRVLKGQKSPVWMWWEQAKKAAVEQNGDPILIFRKNREPWMCLIRLSDLDEPHNVALAGDYVTHDGEDLLLFYLVDLLSVHPENFACAA